LSSSADNSTSRLESLLSISPASAKPGKKICFRQYMHKPRDCIVKNEYHVKFRPWMEEKSGSSAVMSSNASSVTLSMYMAGYTFETVFLKSNHKGTCNANYYMYKNSNRLFTYCHSHHTLRRNKLLPWKSTASR
jgi:hypothetical protein